MTPIDVTTLREAGYNLFTSNFYAKTYGEAYKATLQKSFDDDDGRRYTITVNCLELSVIEDAPSTGRGYIATAQYNMLKPDQTDDYTTFSVEHLIEDTSTIEEMEGLFNKIWHSIKCDYYMKWGN